MAGVFINYRGDDSQLSGALIFNVLADEFGEENVFLDCRSIHIGDDFEEVLMRRLRASTVLLCVIGPHWLNATDATGNRRIEQDGDWVRRELHEAFVRGVRVIPIIMDNAKLPSESDLPADIAELSRRQYLHLRRRYFTQDLAVLVVKLSELDATLTAAARRPRTVRGLSVPHQLPAATTHFAGRDEDLDKLVARLGSGGDHASNIFVISGMAGVGKTSLAVQWCRQIQPAYPDGDLYVDLQGYGPGDPLEPSSVLGAFLRALGVDGSNAPQDLVERAALFRTLLHDRKMVLLLDNARSEEQVRALLPGTSGCAVVVTSRGALVGLVARDGAFRIDLEPLPAESAVELLRLTIGNRVDDEPLAALALANWCARLPLALRIAAERAAERSEAARSEVVQEFSGEQGRLDLLDAGGDPATAIRAVFSWSYHLLSADVALLFRLGGTQPGQTIDAHAMAALAGVSLAETRRGLRALARAHLVNESDSYRVSMHDLLRAYAAELCDQLDPADGRDAALERLFRYYLASTARAMGIIAPHEQDRLTVLPLAADLPELDNSRDALAWLEAERANLVACAKYAATSGRPEWQAFVCWMSNAIFRFLEARAYDDDALAVHAHAVEAARSIGEPLAYCRALTDLGVCYEQVTRFFDALDALGEAAEAAIEAGDWSTAGKALNGRGATLNRLGRHEDALAHHERALAMAQQHRPLQEGHARANLGGTLQELGRLPEAVEQYTRALSALQLEGDPTGQGRTLIRLASAHSQLGDLDAARDCYEQAVACGRKIGSRRIEVDGLNGLGDVARATGAPADALEFHRMALAMTREFTDIRQQAKAHVGLARTYRVLGDHDGNQRHLQQARLAHAGMPDTREAELIRVEIEASVLDSARPA